MSAKTKTTKNLLMLPEPKTVTSSCNFLKKLTGAAVSMIVYTRNIFDEDDFSNKQFEGIDVKIVRGTPHNSNGARCLSNWLEGAFHAMDNKYLKSLVFQIKNDSECLLESYIFHYSYKDDKTQCTVERGSDSETTLMEVSGASREEVRILLRNILVMTSLMPSLPPKCTTLVKINYYDEVTPADYEPPGFKAFVGDTLEFQGVTQKWNCGSVKTPFHSMTVRTIQLEGLIPGSSAPMLTDELSKTIQCLCKMTDTIGFMLKCAKCCSMQHAACYKIFTEEDFSQKIHECLKCCSSDSSTLNKDYDSTECLFRRVLVICAKSKSMSVNKLKQALNLDLQTTFLQLRRLQREGALSKSTQPFTMEKPDFLYNLNKSIIQALKLKYF